MSIKPAAAGRRVLPRRGSRCPSVGEYLKLAIKAVTPGYLASEAVPGGAREWMVPLSPCLRDVDGGGAEFIMGEPTVPRREPADEAGAPAGRVLTTE